MDNHALQAALHDAGVGDKVERSPDVEGWKASHPAGHKTIHWWPSQKPAPAPVEDGAEAIEEDTEPGTWTWKAVDADGESLDTGSCPDTDEGRPALVDAIKKIAAPELKPVTRD